MLGLAALPFPVDHVKVHFGQVADRRVSIRRDLYKQHALKGAQSPRERFSATERHGHVLNWYKDDNLIVELNSTDDPISVHSLHELDTIKLSTLKGKTIPNEFQSQEVIDIIS